MNTPYGPQTSPDFQLLRRIALRMSDSALRWTARDAAEAAEEAKP